uniref:Uncharacterized protein n=2 Tax=environmental samples TaxID=48479 RepID=C7FPK5_9BACT|nr:hypothetical protein [uncultured bacterium HF186_25m_18N5]ACU26508.1 hypothetical protein [uncultured bacterium HF186_25m_27D22]
MKPFHLTITTLGARPSLNIQIEASDWLVALREGLREIGLDAWSDEDVRCQIRADGAVEVTLKGLEDRRFVVMDAPLDLGATLDELDACDPWLGNPSITVDEMAALPFVDQPATRPVRDRGAAQAIEARLYPAVIELRGDREASFREALAMLAAHIPCEHAFFLTPNAARSAWRVSLVAGGTERSLRGRDLSCLSPIPGPVSRLIARRRFPAPTTLTFMADERAPDLIAVSSALWAIARRRHDVEGVFMLLNAPGDLGFTRADYDAAQQIVALVTRRLEAL